MQPEAAPVLMDDEDAYNFIYEDTSPEIEPLTEPVIMDIQAGTRMGEDNAFIDGLRTGGLFEASESNDSRTVNSYQYSINQIHAPEDGPPIRGIDVDQQSRDGSNMAGEDMMSPIRPGPQQQQQRGVNNYPYKGRKGERGTEHVRNTRPKVPKCYSCGKDAAQGAISATSVATSAGGKTIITPTRLSWPLLPTRGD